MFYILIDTLSGEFVFVNTKIQLVKLTVQFEEFVFDKNSLNILNVSRSYLMYRITQIIYCYR